MTQKLLVVVVAVLGMAGCARNPVTGKNQLVLVSEAQEIELGKQAAQEVGQQIGLYKDPKVVAYVDSVGKQLAAKTERPQLPWQFQVVDDPTVNAFALPGGPIFVTRGILTHMNSEAELASVLGHECGHVAARHSVSQLSKAQLAQLGLGLGMILDPRLQKFGQLAGAGMQMLFLKFGRDDERQADELGFGYAQRAGYDMRAMASMFKTLDRVSAQAGGKLPEWLSTHPDPENRVAKTQERLAQAQVDWTKAQLKRDEFLQIINGMTFGENPRQGFFRGSTFLHPELKLQLEFPAGWKTQNLPQVVAAISPQQDAIMQMAVAPSMTPEQAIQKFATLQGVQVGTPSASAINGNPAQTAPFQAQTEQGVVEGIVTFLTYGGNTYQLVGYAPQGKMAARTPEVQRTIGSFTTLTDASALGVQPAKLELVRAPANMSLEQFNTQFPSTVPLDELAIINGLDKGGQVTAGQWVKRVTGGVPGGK